MMLTWLSNFPQTDPSYSFELTSSGGIAASGGSTDIPGGSGGGPGGNGTGPGGNSTGPPTVDLE